MFLLSGPVDYPFTVPGYEQVTLTLRDGIAAKLILRDDELLEQVGRRRFQIKMPNGSEEILEIRLANVFFGLRVIHGKTVIPIGPSVPFYEKVLICLPIFLIFTGVLGGAALGGAAAAINAAIFRGSQPTAIKIVMAIFTIVGAFAVRIFLGMATAQAAPQD